MKKFDRSNSFVILMFLSVAGAIGLTGLTFLSNSRHYPLFLALDYGLCTVAYLTLSEKKEEPIDGLDNLVKQRLYREILDGLKGE